MIAGPSSISSPGMENDKELYGFSATEVKLVYSFIGEPSSLRNTALKQRRRIINLDTLWFSSLSQVAIEKTNLM